jgi:hypothetical protein
MTSFGVNVVILYCTKIILTKKLHILRRHIAVKNPMSLYYMALVSLTSQKFTWHYVGIITTRELKIKNATWPHEVHAKFHKNMPNYSTVWKPDIFLTNKDSRPMKFNYRTMKLTYPVCRINDIITFHALWELLSTEKIRKENLVELPLSN